MLLSLVPHFVYRKEYFMSNDTILFLHNIHWGFSFPLFAQVFPLIKFSLENTTGSPVN